MIGDWKLWDVTMDLSFRYSERGVSSTIACDNLHEFKYCHNIPIMLKILSTRNHLESPRPNNYTPKSLFYNDISLILLISWALTCLKIEKNSHLVCKLAHNTTKVNMERIISLFSTRIIQTIHNTTHLANLWNLNNKNLQRNVNTTT